MISLRFLMVSEESSSYFPPCFNSNNSTTKSLMEDFEKGGEKKERGQLA